MSFEVGKKYKTYGGWPALIIWASKSGPYYCFAIHRPDEVDEESVPITHDGNGTALCTFAVNIPPTYDKHHPADLTEDEII